MNPRLRRTVLAAVDMVAGGACVQFNKDGIRLKP